MANTGERISDHDRVESIQAYLAGTVVAVRTLLDVVDLLAHALDRDHPAREEADKAIRSARTALLTGEREGNGIIQAAKPEAP